MIEVILSTEFTIVKEGIKILLQDESTVKIIDFCKYNEELLPHFFDDNPEAVFLLELNNTTNNSNSIKEILLRLTNAKFLVYTEFDCEATMLDLVQRGLKGYISRDTGKNELLIALDKIQKGSSYITSELALKAIKKYIINRPYHPKDAVEWNISKTEKQVLLLIAQGHTNEEIAVMLFKSRRTIETHRRNLILKTKSANTAALIKFAIENGLIDYNCE